MLQAFDLLRMTRCKGKFVQNILLTQLTIIE
jgi:hypothetical protein